MSYALYCVTSPEPAEYYTVFCDWAGDGLGYENLWIGVSNFSRNAWDWNQVQNNGAIVISADVYFNDNDQVSIAVVCLGNSPWELLKLFISSSGVVVDGTISHDGMQREYVMYIPASYTGDEPVPLVFNFHGYTGTATGHMEKGDFRPSADAAGFIVVHPQGSLDVDGQTHWNVEGHGPGSEADDVGFTDALLDTIASKYNIDLTRVYATGMSNGGFMCYLLACELSDRFAAIASVCGTMAPSLVDACDPQGPMPVLEIHGTADDRVPYDGAATFESIENVLQFWVDHNNCNLTASTAALPNIDPTDGSTVEYVVYGEGDNGVTVEHYKVIGGKHTWPSGGYIFDDVNMDIDAAAEIWNFFAKYDTSGLIEQ